MKRKIFILISFFSMGLSAQEAVIPAFLEKWENSKTYLIAIAKAMPEEDFNYSPTPREMSFKAQLLHIKGNMDWLGQSYFDKSNTTTKQAKPKTKTEVITALEKSFDAVAQQVQGTSRKELATVVDFFAGPKTKLQILNLLQDHVTHHRGQLIVYLNLNEIRPPDYVGW
ncbi:DinB family protein [Spongiimicrobium salis]|uniref:DinB family protein n=1 Tax=Spongiimicrobium salis TaxID=1667022 RepID=UPI00374C91B0